MLAGIRTDASSQIGTGHLMRCLTLADKLREHDGRAVFFIRETEANLVTLVTERGHQVHLLPSVSGKSVTTVDSSYAYWLGTTQEVDASQTIEAITKLGDTLDWLIVDHYALDKKWETLLRPYAHHLFVIDDLANRPHACDILLDQNLYEGMETRYTSCLSSDTIGLYGPSFALLRPEFIQARKQLRKRDGNIHRILVFFGGADIANMAGKTIDAITDWEFSAVQFDIVIGRANPHAKELHKQVARYTNLRIHTDVAQMSELMASADLAIGAAGTTSWERCCLGLPSIITVLADNQRDVAQALHTAGLAINLGSYDVITPAHIAGAIQQLMAMPETVRQMSERCLALVDGNGAERVFAQMQKRSAQAVAEPVTQGSSR